MKTFCNLAYGDHPLQRLDLHLPEGDGPHPLFVYFHGGGLEAGDKTEETAWGEQLVKRGIGFANVNYRLYPQARYPEYIEDAAAATRWCFDHVNEYGACDRIYLGGSSAGAYLTMMLCFDKAYLAAHGMKPEQIAGFFHDAGQPTTHYNVLRERGIDTRRVIVDEAAPLFHIGRDKVYPPMTFIISDDDMENRLEQTMLVMSTLRHFRHEESRYSLRMVQGKHVAYVRRMDDKGDSVFAGMIETFIKG